MNDFIPYGRHDVTDTEIENVLKILRSDWLSQGPTVLEFEKKVADYCGVKFAVAVSNGTAALHLSCLALDLDQNDQMWTSALSFAGSANCALYCGASVDFIDIDARTYNMSPAKLLEKLEQAAQIHQLPKIIIPVHFAGQAPELEKIRSITKKYKIQIIEDGAQALGAEYKGQKVGNCAYSELTTFSFHPVKSITTAEGGMILTNNEILYEKLKLLRSHGMTRDPKLLVNNDGPWALEQITLGYNYRLSDIHSALGVAQMSRLPGFIGQRTLLANRYNQLLEGLPITLPYQHPDTKSSYHIYIIRLQLNKIKKNRKQVFEELRNKNIGVNVHYIPIYRQPYYQNMNLYNPEDFPETEKYYQEAITLPLYPAMTLKQQDKVVTTIKEVLG